MSLEFKESVYTTPLNVLWVFDYFDNFSVDAGII
jgi:hypothetical protein